MARRVGQIIRRGTTTRLVRIYVGRDPESSFNGCLALNSSIEKQKLADC